MQSNSLNSQTSTQESTQESHLPITPETITLIDLVKEEASTLIKETLLSSITQYSSIDKNLLMSLLVIGMETIESTQVKGSHQKEVVINALINVLKLDSVEVNNQEQLISFLENDIAYVIDIIVYASKGKININKVESLTTYLVKFISSCLKKKQ
jgi:hypothetical protein